MVDGAALEKWELAMLLRRLLKLLMKSMLTLLPCRRMDGQVLFGGLLVALLTGYCEEETGQ